MDTVFVVGAGASVEYGFPTGAQLRDRIVDRLMSQEKAHIQTRRDLSEQLGCTGGQVNEAVASLCRALPTSSTIDDCLVRFRHDPTVLEIGKWAILTLIGEAEAQSTLRDGALGGDVWLLKLFRNIAHSVRREEIAERLKRMKFVTFNYDRAIEVGMRRFLADGYDLTGDDLDQVAAHLRVHHIYGSLGKIGVDGAVAYGEMDASAAITSRRSIRVVRETPAAPDTTAISWLSQADRVVFLGFGFLRDNLALLRPRAPQRQAEQKVLGTSLGLSPPTIASLSSELQGIVKAPGLDLHELECSAFVDRFSGFW